MPNRTTMGLLFPAFCWTLLGCIFGSAGAAPLVDVMVHDEGNSSFALASRPAVGRTGWALAGMFACATVAGLALWFCVSRERLRRATERDRLRSLDDERARIARDMHDGLGANLVKIALLGDIIDGDGNDASNLRANVSKMARAARESVRAMDQIVWAVDPRNDTIENLATYLCQFAREHFEVAMIRLDVDVAADLPPGLLSAERRYQVFLAAKEVMTNIVKHAHATAVSMSMRVEAGCFIIMIRDNGCGLPVVSAESRGRGRSNLRERLSALGGSVECFSKPDQGTEFILRLPVCNN